MKSELKLVGVLHTLTKLSQCDGADVFFPTLACGFLFLVLYPLFVSASSLLPLPPAQQPPTNQHPPTTSTKNINSLTQPPTSTNKTSTNNINALTHSTHLLNSITQLTHSTHSLNSLLQVTHSTHSLNSLTRPTYSSHSFYSLTQPTH